MIVSCGEAVADRLPDGSVVAGGSPFNVARALGRLGVRCAFLGALPADATAEPFLAGLRDAGVSIRLVQRVEAPVLSAQVDSSGETSSYVFSPVESADRLLKAPLPGALAGVTALHVGSLSLARTPADGVVSGLVRGFSGFVSLDPNARPTATDDLGAWRARVIEVAALADVVKLSLIDAAQLFPGATEREAVAALFEAGARSVVVTKGPAGSTWHLAGLQLHVAALPVEVADDVGAGDAFSAGLLCGLSDVGALPGGGGSAGGLQEIPTESLAAALRFAAASAAVALARPGAQAPSRAEIGERLLGAAVEVTRPPEL